MMKKLLFLSVLLMSGAFAAEPECALPRGETITIGCSYDCDFFYRFRITMTAWGMGYSAKFVHLHEKPDMKKAMSEVDGILIPGGADIDPRFYMNKVTPDLQEYIEKNMHLVNFSEEGRKRDPFEYELVKTYSSDDTFRNLPLLGICRGLQMMSVAEGIPLYLDIHTELGIKNRRNLFDRIRLNPELNTLIQSLYTSDSFKAYKIHHQGIRVPYFEKHADKFPKTRVTAFSNNRKIAEAIEYTHRPALGVQYHPERSFSGTSVPVFRWFLSKACEYKTSSRKELK